MLAGENNAPHPARQQRSPRGVESGIEEGVSTAYPWVRRPVANVHGRDGCPIDAEPAQVGQQRLTTSRRFIAQAAAGGSASEKRDDGCRIALLLAAVPECTDAIVGREGAGVAIAKHVHRALEQHLRGAAVGKTLNRVTLIVSQCRLNVDVAQGGCRQRHHQIVRFDLLREPRRIRDGNENPIQRVGNRPDDMPKQKAAPRTSSQCVNEAIVASLDALEVGLRRRATPGELLHDGQNGDLGGIREKEPTERVRDVMHVGRRLRLPHPVAQRHRRHFADGL